MKKPWLFWFGNGMVFGILIFAALNAISYFVRSRGWGQLLGPMIANEEAFGFPFEIWRAGKTFDGAFVDQAAFVLNVVTAIAFGTVLGVLGIARSRWLNRFLAAMIDSENQVEGNRLQFSLSGLLLVTSVAAIVAALARQAFGPRPELLGAVYLFGPLFLIALAMIPRHMSWQSRLLLLIPATILLVAFAALIGNRLGLEFDRVMMAIYICWVPQTVIAAICLIVARAILHTRKIKANKA